MPATAPSSAPSLVTSTGRILPLTDVAIDVQVDGTGYVATVAQVFANDVVDDLPVPADATPVDTPAVDPAAPIEVVYTFPLPGGTAVNGCTMRVGERVLHAELKEREAAREEYDTAVAEGYTASYVEQQSSEVFEVRVGNIAAGTEVEIELVLHGEVLVDGTEATVRIPTLVAPRYTSPKGKPSKRTVTDTSTMPRMAGASSAVSTRATISIAGTGAGIALQSPSHHVTSADRSLELTGIELDRDLVWRWSVPSSFSEARWIADDGASADGEGTIEVVVRGDEPSDVDRAPKDVMILLDRSGSMGGWGQSSANQMVIDMIGALSSGDTVRVMTFDTTHELLPACASTPVVIGTAAVRRLIDQVRMVEARGGTELIGALSSAGGLLAPTEGRERVLVLITDGQFGNESEAVRLRSELFSDVRVMVVGIDMAVSGGFLTELAAGSYVELVESESRRVEVTQRVCERLNTPLHRGLSIEGATQPTRDRGIDVYPRQVVRLAGRCARPGATVTLTGSDGARITVPVAESSDASIRTRWAAGRLTVLEHAGADDDEIVALSVAHRVQCRHTAWVVVDREGARQGGSPELIVQPVEDAAGWSMSGTVGLATFSMARSAPTRMYSARPMPLADAVYSSPVHSSADMFVEVDLVELRGVLLQLAATGALDPAVIELVERLLPFVDAALRRKVRRLHLADLMAAQVGTGSLDARVVRRVQKVLGELLDSLPVSTHSQRAHIDW